LRLGVHEHVLVHDKKRSARRQKKSHAESLSFASFCFFYKKTIDCLLGKRCTGGFSNGPGEIKSNQIKSNQNKTTHHTTTQAAWL
jgi:hypothetical protein